MALYTTNNRYVNDTEEKQEDNLSKFLLNDDSVSAIYSRLQEDANLNYKGYLNSDDDYDNSIKKIIIFRHNDLDGRAAGAALLNFIMEKRNSRDDNVEIVIHEIDYNTPLEDEVDKNTEVWFIDFSIQNDNVEYLKKIMKNTDHIVWCDHHATSLETIKNNIEFKNIFGIVRDYKLSGAILVWVYCSMISGVNKFVPDILKYVSDYDTFSLHMYYVKEFYFGTQLYNMNPEVMVEEKLSLWETLLNDKTKSDKIIGEMIEKGTIIRDYNLNTDKLEHIDNYGFEKEFEGLKIFVINRRGNSFMFGDKYDQYDAVCTFYYDGNRDLYNYSLYSDTSKNIDVSKIAKKYNGGGHPGASGFSSRKNLFQ